MRSYGTLLLFLDLYSTHKVFRWNTTAVCIALVCVLKKEALLNPAVGDAIAL
jgi:hypothetical protein